MISLKVKFLQSLAEKTKGLIGANPVFPVFFTTRWGIHTFGVLYPLDILILDKNNSVVGMNQNMKPNRFFFWNPIYENVVELPASTIEKMKIAIGSQITLSE